MASSEGELSACLPPGEAEPLGIQQEVRELRSSRGPILRWAGVIFSGAVLVVVSRTAVQQEQEQPTPAHTSGAHAVKNSSTGKTFLSLYYQSNGCTDYFSVGQDCSKKNLWECVGDDGSQGYACCCKHGFGDFKTANHMAIGTINWGKDPTKCVDLTMPYVGSGVPFVDGNAMLASCNWGNPNKLFHMPLKGQGKVEWGTHPKFCLGPMNGGAGAGTMVKLIKCFQNPQWGTWTVDAYGGDEAYKKPHLIRYSANPSMCMASSGEEDGSPIQLAACNKRDKKQLFNFTVPPEPPSYADTPSLFCIALMLPHGYEKGMLEDQFSRKVGIFECNDYAVYSNVSITLRGGDRELKTDVMKGSLAVKFGGQWHSALNTDVFIRFWEKVVEDSRTWKNVWTAKLDPDAVFFPSRLQELLRSRWYGGNPKKPIYLNNCHRGMHGPIEVVSQQGLKAYKKDWKSCKEGEPYKHKQEDFYFRRCWALLNISKVEVYNLLFENLYACDERSDTRDGRHPCFSRQVSFHPFKTAKSWYECYRRGKSMQWVSPMTINSQEPGPDNFHHA